VRHFVDLPGGMGDQRALEGGGRFARQSGGTVLSLKGARQGKTSKPPQ